MALPENDPLYLSAYFRMFVYKIETCPRIEPHDWTQCPFSHTTEKASRRDPTVHRISQTSCIQFRKHGSCQAGRSCPLAHGVFESWLAPSKYCTQICTQGPQCKRRVCFFAHSPSELRAPTPDDPGDALLLREHLLAELYNTEHAHRLQAIYNATSLVHMEQMVGERLCLIQHALNASGQWVLPRLLNCSLDDLRGLSQNLPAHQQVASGFPNADSRFAQTAQPPPPETFLHHGPPWSAVNNFDHPPAFPDEELSLTTAGRDSSGLTDRLSGSSSVHSAASSLAGTTPFSARWQDYPRLQGYAAQSSDGNAQQGMLSPTSNPRYPLDGYVHAGRDIEGNRVASNLLHGSFQFSPRRRRVSSLSEGTEPASEQTVVGSLPGVFPFQPLTVPSEESPTRPTADTPLLDQLQTWLSLRQVSDPDDGGRQP